MTDPQLLERLSAYLDGALPASEKAAVEALLARDPEARKILDGMKAVSSQLKETPLLTPPEALYRRVLREIETPAPRPFFSYVPMKTLAAVCAAALVMVATGDHWRAWLRREQAMPSPVQMMQAPAKAQEKARMSGHLYAPVDEVDARAAGRASAVDKDGGKTDAPAQSVARDLSLDAVSSAVPAEAKMRQAPAAPVEELYKVGAISKKEAFAAPAPRPVPMAVSENELRSAPAPALAGAGRRMEEKTAFADEAPARTDVVSALKQKAAVPTEWRGVDSAVREPLTVSVQTEEQWKTLWARHAPGRPVPAVDFSRFSAIAVFAGEKPTGGHAVAITGVGVQNGETVVSYRETPPQADAFTAQVLTSPYHIRLIPRSSRIRFKKN
jgi:anti-sigma factor RsiW